MADIVALDFKSRAVLRACREDVFDILEGVPENALARRFEIALLPVMFERPEAFKHRVEAEIHRSHVERGDLRLENCGGSCALLYAHRRRAAGRDVDHAIRSLLDDLQKRQERVRRLVGPAVLRVSRMEMNDRGT